MIKQDPSVTIFETAQAFMKAFSDYANAPERAGEAVITISMESLGDFKPHILFESSTGEQSASLDQFETQSTPGVVIYRNKMNRYANHGLADINEHFNDYDWGELHFYPPMFQPTTKQAQRALEHVVKVLYDFLVKGMSSEILGTTFHQLMSNPDYLAEANEDQRRMNMNSGRPSNYGLWELNEDGRAVPVAD